MKILKFGGSSIGSPEKIKAVLEIIKVYPQNPFAVVFSAFGGTTNQLIQLSEQALTGDTRLVSHCRELEDEHLNFVKELLPLSKQSKVIGEVKILFNELSDFLHGISLVKECSPRSLDHILSFGERLSTSIITQAMSENGLVVEYVDARNIIQTDNDHGKAIVDFRKTNELVRDHFEKHKGIQVVTGFIARSGTGETTTLGRSGSDYTAAILAGALEADELEIWTDVDGMMTADPKLVKKAFTIPEISYEEAMELSHFGAKVIFPSALRPAIQHGIPLRVKNTFNPSGTGTCISNNPGNGKLIKGISSINDISLLNIQGSGMIGVAGIAKRLFSCLANERINVILISQASSEHSICIALKEDQISRARMAVEDEFRYEIEQRLIESVVVTEDHAIIAVVGDGMKHHPGTSGRLFYTLGRNGVNIVAIAQGSSERNISVVIDKKNVRKALNAIHDSFFLSKTKTINLFVAGTGLIGGTLLKQIATQKHQLFEDTHLDLQLIALANSRKMLFDSDGIDPNNGLSTLALIGATSDAEEFSKRIVEYNLPNSVFVDCTASEEVSMQYGDLLQSSISVVAANKKANSGSIDNYVFLRNTSRTIGSRFLYETNVGAGLPVINTINDLLLSGDKILRIESVLSGTLNYIFSAFTEERDFSDVVVEAQKKGYTEPDPRDDLNGMDVARKILILARETGAQIELSDIEIESMVPKDCEGDMSLDEFFDKLSQHDPTFKEQLVKTSNANEKLRYQAVFENGKIQVGLSGVSSEHPFYSLGGSDNMILLTTERYKERPMVIRGPGAGAEVTAAGIFADIIRIGNYVRL